MDNRRPPAGARKKPPPGVRSPEAQASALRQTRREHSIETAQDYVEAIAELMASTGEARAVDLARRLGVSHVTVVRTVAPSVPGLRGLRDDMLVEVDGTRGIVTVLSE